MYLVRKDTELDFITLGRIIMKFRTTDLPKMNKYYNYYKGKQAIMLKQATDVGKPCNRVVINYCANIVDTYNGYLTGIDIAYSSDDEQFEEIQEVLDYNDIHYEDSQFLKYALIFGRAAELNYIDQEGQQRFKYLDPREVIDVYDDTLEQNLVYAIRCYAADYLDDNVGESFIVEVYDDKNCYKYKSTMGFASFELIESTPHYFGMVPVTFFNLNEEQDSIFDRVMSLQDAYNELLSGEVDSWDAFADAYLILKGCDADADDLAAMKQNRVLILDNDADAEYLTKNVSDTQITDILQNINDQIHKIALSPDFNDDKFMSQSGIALRYKLIGMENNASAIEANMRKALQKRIELITAILNLTYGEQLWRDVDIHFTRNLPTNETEIAQMVNSLRGLVSDETLLAQLPFIADPQEEYEKLKAQKEESMDMYLFASKEEDKEVSEDEATE